MTHLVFALSLSITVATVSAYDFHDSFFNELLADELEDWDILAASGNNHGRPRRSPIVLEDEETDKILKCKHHYGKMCCGKGRWLKNFGDADKKTVTGCLSSFDKKMNTSGIPITGGDPFSCEKINQMKMKVICTTECVGKKHELVTEDGSLNIEKVNSYVEKLELESWQRPLVDEAIAKCAPVANKLSREP